MGASVDLVVIGNIAIQKEINKRINRTFTEISGSAWYCILGVTSVDLPVRVGVVSVIGYDYIYLRKKLDEKHIDTRGIVVHPTQKTAVFEVVEEEKNRIFTARMNAASYRFHSKFPKEYLQAKHIHLSTNFPHHHLAWIRYLRPLISGETTISADTFESYATDYPALTLDVFQAVDLVFFNEVEFSHLKKQGFVPKGEYVLKRGENGAIYTDGSTRYDVAAPKVPVTSTSGAGEVLAAVFLQQRIMGKSPLHSLQFAVTHASAFVSQPRKALKVDDALR